MAEQEKQVKSKEKPKSDKAKEPVVKKRPEEKDSYESLVRILGYDLPGTRNLYSGLTRIK